LRLTTTQYANTIRDLLQIPVTPADLGDDSEQAGFQAGASLSSVDATRLRDAAERIGREAQKKLAVLLPCDPARGDDTCIGEFIKGFGRRAFRRPLSEAEAAGLLALHKKVRTDLKADFANATRVLIQTIVQAPELLYRWERTGDDAGKVTRLQPFEVASRLAFTFWSSTPDDQLLDAAAKGELDTTDGIAKQTRRLLADARAKDGVASFFRQWVLHGGDDAPVKDPKAAPEYSPEVWGLMQAELALTTRAALDAGKGGLRALLTAPTGYVNAKLAPIYGMKGVTGAELTRTALDGTQRAGLLTGVAFLTRYATAAGSHPVKRGAWVYERLLCGALPPVPPEVPPVKAAAPNLSTRERFADHASNPCARACHGLIDPVGFAFESYDGIGKFRAVDGGKPVDASGELTLPSGGEKRRFANAHELLGLIADSSDARSCMAKQWLRFSLGRLEAEADTPSINYLRDGLARTDDLGELVVSLTVMPSFLYRASTEVSP
jgi:hypothetical protein